MPKICRAGITSGGEGTMGLILRPGGDANGQPMTNRIPEWRKFRVGKVSESPKWANPECQRLEEIHHVAHIPVAIEILRSGNLNPRLIYDKSKLNRRRITVTWLSPNWWSDGSRYGNVQFSFDWKKLVGGEDKKFYWVEHIDYGVPACRILITKKDYTDDEDLLEYDPTLGDGPWWWDKTTDTHYWNGKYCLEIMAESPLPIAKCTDFNFVKHHPNFCCIDPAACSYRGLSSERANALFLASAISLEINLSQLNLIKDAKNTLDYSHVLFNGWRSIWSQLKNAHYRGQITSKTDAAIPLARAILGAFARSNTAESECLTALFKSETEFRASLEALFTHVFNFPSPDLNEDFDLF